MEFYEDFWGKISRALMERVPGFGIVLDMISADYTARMKRRMKMKEARKEAELEIKYLGHRRGEEKWSLMFDQIGLQTEYYTKNDYCQDFAVAKALACCFPMTIILMQHIYDFW